MWTAKLVKNGSEQYNNRAKVLQDCKRVGLQKQVEHSSGLRLDLCEGEAQGQQSLHTTICLSSVPGRSA